MVANFWSFSKRINSDELPSDSPQYTQNVVFKDESDYTKPTLEMVGGSLRDVNYCQIPELKRYYFITEITAIAYDTYVLQLETDLLGTFRNEIIGQSFYMAYSDSFGNDLLDDKRVVPTKIKYWDSDIHPLDIFGNFVANAPTTTQCVSLVTSNGLLNGNDIFYGANAAKAYMSKLNDRSWLKEFVQDAQGVNPYDAINGAWATPLVPSECNNVQAHTAQVNGIQVGGNAIKNFNVKQHAVTIKVPPPPYSDFRKSSRFGAYGLYLPYVGEIEIPVELALWAREATRTFQVMYAGDCISGQVAYAVAIDDMCLGIYATNVKTDLPVAGQSSVNSQTSTMVAQGGFQGALIGAQSGGGKGALVGGALGALSSLFVSSYTPPSIFRISSGGGGGALCAVPLFSNSVILSAYYCGSSESPDNFSGFGTPTQAVRTIAAGCGYVQTVGATVAITGLMSEAIELNRMLDGGCYFV